MVRDKYCVYRFYVLSQLMESWERIEFKMVNELIWCCITYRWLHKMCKYLTFLHLRWRLNYLGHNFFYISYVFFFPKEKQCCSLCTFIVNVIMTVANSNNVHMIMFESKMIPRITNMIFELQLSWTIKVILYSPFISVHTHHHIHCSFQTTYNCSGSQLFPILLILLCQALHVRYRGNWFQETAIVKS